MSTYDLMFMWHSVCNVARNIWETSPTAIVMIGVVLFAVVFFSAKH